MAEHALRQVPGVLPPGRSRSAAGGAGGTGAPPVRRGAPDQPRAAARDHPEPLRGAGRRHARSPARSIGSMRSASSPTGGSCPIPAARRPGMRSPQPSSAMTRTAAACCCWAWTPRRPRSRPASSSPRASRCARASRSAAPSSARRRAPGCRARSTTRPRSPRMAATYSGLIEAWQRARARSGIRLSSTRPPAHAVASE